MPNEHSPANDGTGWQYGRADLIYGAPAGCCAVGGRSKGINRRRGNGKGQCGDHYKAEQDLEKSVFEHGNDPPGIVKSILLFRHYRYVRPM
jgi:hypothetical protein